MRMCSVTQRHAGQDRWHNHKNVSATSHRVGVAVAIGLVFLCNSRYAQQYQMLPIFLLLLNYRYSNTANPGTNGLGVDVAVLLASGLAAVRGGVGSR